MGNVVTPSQEAAAGRRTSAEPTEQAGGPGLPARRGYGREAESPRNGCPRVLGPRPGPGTGPAEASRGQGVLGR